MNYYQVVGWSVHGSSGILGPLYCDPKGAAFFLDVEAGVFLKFNRAKMKICLDVFLRS